MMLSTSKLAFLAAPLAVTAVPATTVIGSQCSANNCLRALRAPDRLTQAQQDCQSWLRTTVTPPVVIQTEFLTIDSTSTITTTLTLDNTIQETATAIASETSTVTVVVTSTLELPLVGAPTNLKRDVSYATSSIPAYASPCSGAVRYSSACSCISATPVTATAAASTTTTTIPTTAWHTETETSLATQDVLVTVETVTSTTIVATTTVTSVAATATVTPFRLTIDDQYGRFYLYTVANNEFMLLTQDESRAARFEMTPEGRVTVGNRFFGRYINTGVQYSRVFPPASERFAWVIAFQCGLDAARAFSCQIPANPARQWGTQIWRQPDGSWQRYAGTGVLHATPEEYASSTSNNWSPVVLRAIPAA